MKKAEQPLDQTFDKQILSDEQHSALLTSARSGLVVASQHDESGLSPMSHGNVRARVLDVTMTSSGKPQIHIDSSGLSLDQKLFLERVLLRHLDGENLSDVTINFRKASSSSSQGTQPSPVGRKAPFGLSINKRPIPGVHNILAVASGKGGVGKSTIAANLAAGFAMQGLRVGLMDCDVYGPSAQIMFGLSGSMEVRNNRLIPLERHGVRVVSFGFLSDAKSPVIWRGPMVAKAIEQLCYDVDWGDLDVLVLDLPPGTGDVQLTLAERIPVTGSVIVTTPQEVALVDAHKAVSMFEKLGVPIWGVVENMALHTCSACGHQDEIFGQIEFDNFLKNRDLSCLTKLPLSKEIRVAGDTGTPIVLSDHMLSKVYQRLAESVSMRLSNTN